MASASAKGRRLRGRGHVDGWMGTLSYDVRDRKLNHPPSRRRAGSVRIFKRFVSSNGDAAARELVVAGAKPIRHLLDKGCCVPSPEQPGLHWRSRAQGLAYPVSTKPLSTASSGTRPHPFSRERPRKRAQRAGSDAGTLKGLCFGPEGAAYVPDPYPQRWAALPLLHHQSVMKRCTQCASRSDSSPAEIERIVLDQIRSLLQTPEVIVQPGEVRPPQDRHSLSPRATSVSALLEFEPLWNELVPGRAGRDCRAAWSNASICNPTASTLRLRVKGYLAVARVALRRRAPGCGMTAKATVQSVSSARPTLSKLSHHHGRQFRSSLRHHGGRKQVVHRQELLQVSYPAARLQHHVKAIVARLAGGTCGSPATTPLSLTAPKRKPQRVLPRPHPSPHPALTQDRRAISKVLRRRPRTRCLMRNSRSMDDNSELEG